MYQSYLCLQFTVPFFLMNGPFDSGHGKVHIPTTNPSLHTVLLDLRSGDNGWIWPGVKLRPKSSDQPWNIIPAGRNQDDSSNQFVLIQ